ncbi:hypothetical protein ACFQYP_31320 [Nonomuraea antimicrobica]
MTSTAREPRDSELLRIELGVIWRLDGLGRLPGPEDLVIGVAADGMVAAVASVVPDPLAGRLLSLVADGGELPDVVVGCQALLGGMGVAVSRGPSYLVEPPLGYDAGVEVLTSAVPAHARLVRPLRPGNWEPGEWDDLLGGREGAPWAMIVEDGQVAAVCHTARLTPAGAEAGTWTAPAYRGAATPPRPPPPGRGCCPTPGSSTARALTTVPPSASPNASASVPSATSGS